MLKEKGAFYLTIKVGSGEGLEKDLRYGDFEKFWSFYEEKELKDLVQSAKFKILDCTTVQKEAAYQTGHCIRIFCQKE